MGTRASLPTSPISRLTEKFIFYIILYYIYLLVLLLRTFVYLIVKVINEFLVWSSMWPLDKKKLEGSKTNILNYRYSKT